MSSEIRWSEIAPAKINLALHVRARRADGRHDIETLFAFCTDGDRLSAEPAEALSLEVSGPFAEQLGPAKDNLVLTAARALAERSGCAEGAKLRLVKSLPVASGIGGGSADAAAALRLLTAMWGIDPSHASAVAPAIGSDVPACLLSMTCRGEGAGDALSLVQLPELAGKPVLLVNPRIQLSTRAVFGRWDGQDRGALDRWQSGRNDLEQSAAGLVPQIGLILAWLREQAGAEIVRMSGSGASCFALFDSEAARDQAAEAAPREWWRLATTLR